MNGANLVIESLKAHKVTTLFGYPGGAIMPIYDALYDSGLDHLLCRNEQGAAMEAIGYARSTGKVGVCFATSGPGATNLITGLADALLDSVPIVAITGQVSSHLIGTDGFQEVDVLGLSLGCTKHSYIVENIEELSHILAEAFMVAQSGRPGPVLVDIPRDIQLTETDATPFCLKVPNIEKQEKENLEKAVELLSYSKQPVLYVGGGVGIAESVQAVRSLVKFANIPAISTLKGLGSLDPKDPLYLGMVGMHGTKVANIATHKADLLIVCGARFDDRVTGKLDTFAPNAKVIHIDIDVAEINKLRKADVSLCGNLKQAVTYLAEFAKDNPLNIDIWREEIKALKDKFNFTYQENEGDRDIDPWALLNTLSNRKNKNAVIVTDVGQHQMWSAQHMTHFDPKNFITSAGLGTMGFGLPAAIGAKKARPEDDVILVTGDGSFLMNIQELGTIKRGSVGVKIVLLDNQRLGMVRQWQTLFFNQRHSETILDDNPDFVTLAKAFDIQGERIEKANEVSEALDRMLNAKGAYLLHICIPSNENVWPLVPPNSCNLNMLETN